MNRKRLTMTVLVLLSLGTIIGVYAGTVGVNNLFGFDNITADVEYYRNGVNYTQFIASRYGSDQSLNTTDGVTFAGVTAGEYFLNAVNKTDIFAYPQQSASYIVWIDGGTYYAKNGTTGTIDITGADGDVFLQAVNDATPVGGKILMLAGTYIIDTQLSLSKITLQGEARDSVIIQSDTANIIMLRCDNTILMDFTIKGTTNCRGVYFYPELMFNLYIKDCTGASGRGFSTINECLISNCVFENNYSNTPGYQVKIINCDFLNHGEFVIGTAGYYINIIDCYIYEAGMGAIKFGQGAHDNTVIGNLIVDVNETGIEFRDNVTNCVATGNTLLETRAGGDPLHYALDMHNNKNCVMSSNIVTGNWDRGLWLKEDDHAVSPVDNNVIIGNILNATVPAVIELAGGTGNIIKDNPYFDTEGSGTATVYNTNTTVSVIHGLDVTPTSISITPSWDASAYVTAINGNNFNVTFTDPTATKTLYWVTTYVP